MIMLPSVGYVFAGVRLLRAAHPTGRFCFLFIESGESFHNSQWVENYCTIITHLFFISSQRNTPAPSLLFLLGEFLPLQGGARGGHQQQFTYTMHRTYLFTHSSLSATLVRTFTFSTNDDRRRHYTWERFFAYDLWFFWYKFRFTLPPLLLCCYSGTLLPLDAYAPYYGNCLREPLLPNHPSSMKLSTAGGKTLGTQNLNSALLFMSCFYYYMAELINIFHHTW